MKNIFVLVRVCLILYLCGSLASCKNENQLQDPSIYQNVEIEKEDKVGFEWIDYTKSDINQENVELNWKLSLKDELRQQDWYCYDNNFWLLDKHDLFHVDVPTGEIEYNNTSESWSSILLHYQDKLFMLSKQKDGTFEIQAYQPSKKQIVWTKSLEDKTELSLGRKIIEGVLYIVNSSGVLFAISVNDGSEVWRFNAHEEIRSDVFIVDNKILLACKDSSCYAIDKSNGKVLWKRQDIFIESTPTAEYRPFTSIDGIIGYFGNLYEPFIFVEEESGKLVWEYPYSSNSLKPYADSYAKKPSESISKHSWPDWKISSFEKPYAVDGTIVLLFTANYEKNLHVLDPLSKKVLWEKENIKFCHTTIDEKILIGRYINKTNVGKFVIEKLDPKTGNVLWSNDTFVDITNVEEIEIPESKMMDQHILISDFKGNMFLIDTTDGNLVWAYSSNDTYNFVNFSTNKNVFFAEQFESNSIYCFSLVG